MKIELKQVEGFATIARGPSNHWVTLDTTPENGGMGAGATPMEHVLMGLMGCSAIDVMMIMKKRRAMIEDFSIEAEAERREETPRVFTKIHLTYKFQGAELKEKDIIRAIRLSEEKYCSVSKMLKPTVEITSSYEITE